MPGNLHKVRDLPGSGTTVNWLYITAPERMSCFTHPIDPRPAAVTFRQAGCSMPCQSVAARQPTAAACGVWCSVQQVEEGYTRSHQQHSSTQVHTREV